MAHCILCSLPSCPIWSPIIPSGCAPSLPNPCLGWLPQTTTITAFHLYWSSSFLEYTGSSPCGAIALAFLAVAGCFLPFTSHFICQLFGKASLSSLFGVFFPPTCLNVLSSPLPCFMSTTLIFIWNYLFGSVFTCLLDDFSLDYKLSGRDLLLFTFVPPVTRRVPDTQKHSKNVSWMNEWTVF